MYLKDVFPLITWGTKPISENLHTFKGICDELALIVVPQDENDIVIQCFQRLGREFKEVVAILCQMEQSCYFITFENLYFQSPFS